MIRDSWKTAWALLGLALLVPTAAEAGQLVLKNASANPIACTVDGWTSASGGPFDWYIAVPPGQSFNVGQNTTRQGPEVINWASCGALTTRAMNITPTGPDGTLLLNGQQTRVLNVALYPYLPNAPGQDFSALVTQVVTSYQQANPQVLLSAQMNQGTDIYTFATLPALFGQSGLDVVELDTVVLGYLVSQNLINPAQIAGQQPYKVALDASTVNNQLWGIPSWLCMDFIYSTNAGVQQATTLASLLQFLQQSPGGKPQLVGDYNGSWTLLSSYINACVQNYGYGAIGQALQMPPDPTAIGNLVSLSDTCLSAGANNCTNGQYHGSAVPGVTEQVFAAGGAGADKGYSEQSFYIRYYGQAAPLYVAPAAWGPKPQPLLYSDSFVTSRATCPTGSTCASDSAAFTTLMTSLPMKNYIVKSQDLPGGSPWRTLLVAQQSFYQQPEIQNNAMYRQYAQVFAAGQPYPNSFTANLQAQMGYAICTALQAQRPQFDCKTGPGALPAPAPTPAPSGETR